MAVSRPTMLAAAAALAVGVGPAAAAGCSAPAARNPSYLLVTLDVPTSLPSPPHAARIEVTSAATPGAPQSLCVQLEAPGAAVPASFVLERDYGKDPAPRVTLQITAFDSLEGGSDAIAGKDFPCPSVLPPPLASQTVTVDFCAAMAEKLVFHVGSSCCPTADGGAQDGGDAEGGTGGGGTDGGGTDGGSETADGGMGDGGAGACGCPPLEVCGAGLGTDGYACAPDTCCATKVTSACALDPAQ